ncbi:MAG: DUF488 domain-containing protein [Chloroflexi bacterium]|nr:DUF488 domain-containing protein [Chloroflexota bacterium]
MKVYTIGFTKKSASDFFEVLRNSDAKRLVDVRLNNVSQLAGFAKRDDLEYFLRELCRINYIHLPELAPTKEMLDAYRNDHRDWGIYEREFIDLMSQRRIEKMGIKRMISNSCLLCSEDKPDKCHRRLVAEYLNGHWGDVEIVHLG